MTTKQQLKQNPALVTELMDAAFAAWDRLPKDRCTASFKWRSASYAASSNFHHLRDTTGTSIFSSSTGPPPGCLMVTGASQ
jgi:hypothetical protein